MKLPIEPKPRETDLSKYKFLIYGAPKAGKSTFASKFEKAIFIPTEPGLNYLEVFTITDDEGKPKVVKNWTELCDAVRLLCTQKHDFKTVVIDTVDNALEFCAMHLLKQREIEHESDEGFGKGYMMITREFKKVLNHLAAQGIGVVFISHEKTAERESKGIKRQYTDSSMSNSGRNFINGLVDFIFYCYQDKNHLRWMQTKGTANLNAGDRTGHLPAEMRLDFPTFKKELELALSKQAADDEIKPEQTETKNEPKQEVKNGTATSSNRPRR